MIQCVFVRLLAVTAAKSIDEMHINRNNGNKFSSAQIEQKKSPPIVILYLRNQCRVLFRGCTQSGYMMNMESIHISP